MKSIIASFVLALALCATGLAQNLVTVPNANFAAWLQTNYATCMTGNQLDTTCTAVTSATNVSISNQGITNLDGIQYFDNLLYLTCDNNAVGTLPRLPSNLTALTSQGCQLTALPALPATLTSLIVGANQLISLPSLPATLTYLDVHGNPSVAISVLPASMTHFDMQSCNLGSLPSLPSGLNSLLIGNNPLGTLPVLPPGLQILSANSTGITALPALPNSITRLDVQDNPGLHLPSSLPTSLLTFHCENITATSLPALPAALQELIASNNLLTSLPALPATLTRLEVISNQLTSLPALPNGLQQLVVYYNQLQSVSNLPATLYNADFRWNNITCFGPFPQSASLNVSFANNPVSCLPNYAAFMTPNIGTVPICTTGNPMGCAAGEGIGGKIFDDLNSDCIFNGLDPGISNIPLHVYDNTGLLVQGGASYAGGSYFFEEPIGTWDVRMDTTGKPFHVTCAVPGVDSTVVLSLGSTLALGVDFELDCKPGFDLATWGASLTNQLFPGVSFECIAFAGDMSSRYGMHCAAGVAGQVVVMVTGPVTYLGPSIGAMTPVVAGNTYTYTISDFGLLQPAQDLRLRFVSDTSMHANDIVCIDISVTPTVGDNLPANNSHSYCYYGTNSYDPNFKTATPSRVEELYSDWIYYDIHFQNLGNAPAMNIRIRDTLDPNLDLATLEVVHASHYETWALMGNEFVVTFPNIMLPDSASNPSASMGGIYYRVKPKTGLLQGTIIHNMASIYFDFNAPVVTDDATTTYNIVSGVPDVKLADAVVQVFPNPSTGIFQIAFPADWKSAEWSVSNMMGQNIAQGTAKDASFSIDLGAMPDGMYMLRLTNGNRRIVRGVVKR